MIFAGDVAIAHRDRIIFDGFPECIYRESWCINLEGAISSCHDPQMWGTYNSPEWIGSFKDFKIGSVFAANNHIHDVPGGIAYTDKWLSERGIAMFGAGINFELAARPATFFTSGIKFSIIGFGWPVIGCFPAKKDKPGVNSFKSDSVRAQVRDLLAGASDHRIVVLIHGNYEFEIYPQPAHRKLAQELIDLGVYSVIFHHPHVVGPIERYKDRLIAYSLGNWAFSYGRFFGGKLKFTESSFHQIAVELGRDKTIVHHADFYPPSKVIYGFSEELSSSEFTLRPEFEGLSNRDYIKWFKKHRVKRKGLPIYRDPEAYYTNAVRDQWVRVRQFAIDMAAKMGLKRMRNGG